MNSFTREITQKENGLSLTQKKKMCQTRQIALHWENACEAIPTETTIFEMCTRQKFIAISESLSSNHLKEGRTLSIYQDYLLDF